MPDFADEGGVVLLFAFLGVGEAGGLGGEGEDVAVVAVVAALLLHELFCWDIFQIKL